jgi:hypothetical protein
MKQKERNIWGIISIKMLNMQPQYKKEEQKVLE